MYKIVSSPPSTSIYPCNDPDNTPEKLVEVSFIDNNGHRRNYLAVDYLSEYKTVPGSMQELRVRIMTKEGLKDVPFRFLSQPIRLSQNSTDLKNILVYTKPDGSQHAIVHTDSELSIFGEWRVRNDNTEGFCGNVTTIEPDEIRRTGNWCVLNDGTENFFGEVIRTNKDGEKWTGTYAYRSDGRVGFLGQMIHTKADGLILIGEWGLLNSLVLSPGTEGFLNTIQVSGTSKFGCLTKGSFKSQDGALSPVGEWTSTSPGHIVTLHYSEEGHLLKQEQNFTQESTPNNPGSLNSSTPSDHTPQLPVQPTPTSKGSPPPPPHQESTPNNPASLEPSKNNKNPKKGFLLSLFRGKKL